MLQRLLSSAIVAVLLCFFFAGLSPAATMTFRTAPGTTLCDPLTNSCDAVDVGAQFITSNNEIHIVVVNFESNPIGDISNLNQIDFHISSGASLNSTITSTSILRTVLKDGTYTAPGPYSTADLVSTQWGLQNLTQEFIVDGRATSSTFPKGTLIGMPDSNNLYSSANGSITTKSHNPFVATISLSYTDPLNPTFDIKAPSNSGITAATTITGVTFYFGTGSGLGTSGIQQNATPEPDSAAFLLIGSGFLLAGVKRARSQASRRSEAID